MWSVNYRQIFWKSWFLEIQLLGMLTSRNFAEISLLTTKFDPENFKIDISKIGYFTEKSVKCQKSWSVKYRMANRMRTRSDDFLGNIIPSIYRQWPTFKSFWWVELKPVNERWCMLISSPVELRCFWKPNVPSQYSLTRSKLLTTNQPKTVMASTKVESPYFLTKF